MSTFHGFPKETLTFLRALERNNDKTWFDAHRAEYESRWVAPAKAFVVAAGEALTEIAPRVRAEPRVNGSIFRINRDVRFSKDKTPYKTTLDFWFWEGERKGAVSGFFMRVTPKYLGIGVGAHGFDKARLASFRDAVVEPGAARRLAKAVARVEKAGFPVKGEHYKRVPRGFEPQSELQERLIRHAGLWCGEDTDHPAAVHTGRLVGYAMTRWKKLEPLHRWLVDEIGS